MPHSTTSASSANVCITRDADPSGLMLKSFSPSREKKKNKCQMKGTPYLFSLFFFALLQIVPHVVRILHPANWSSRSRAKCCIASSKAVTPSFPVSAPSPLTRPKENVGSSGNGAKIVFREPGRRMGRIVEIFRREAPDVDWPASERQRDAFRAGGFSTDIFAICPDLVRERGSEKSEDVRRAVDVEPLMLRKRTRIY